jgi:hypothetical protein
VDPESVVVVGVKYCGDSIVIGHCVGCCLLIRRFTKSIEREMMRGESRERNKRLKTTFLFVCLFVWKLY